MRFDSPILDYLQEVLEEHTLPLADPSAGLVEADWLLEMIRKLEAAYQDDGRS